jgi:hypothetical protein
MKKIAFTFSDSDSLHHCWYVWFNHSYAGTPLPFRYANFDLTEPLPPLWRWVIATALWFVNWLYELDAYYMIWISWTWFWATCVVALFRFHCLLDVLFRSKVFRLGGCLVPMAISLLIWTNPYPRLIWGVPLVGDESLLDIDLNLLKLENIVFYHNADY